MNGFIGISIKTSNPGVTFTSGVRSRDQSETEAMTALDSLRLLFSSRSDHLSWQATGVCSALLNSWACQRPACW